MPDFIVKVDGIKLSKEQEANINREVQSAVLRELARFDFGSDLTVRIPRKEWLGIWIRNKIFEAGNIKLEINQINR